jgi:ElaB/YqjD/DUF883 family membrane-anchored ribosome-binding protein
MDPNTRPDTDRTLDADSKLDAVSELDPTPGPSPEAGLNPEPCPDPQTRLDPNTGLDPLTPDLLSPDHLSPNHLSPNHFRPDPPNPTATNPTATSPAATSPEFQAAKPRGGGAAPLPLVNSFRERFEALLPRIQEQWPSVARHSLEASRGSLEEVAAVIAAQTGRTATVVQEQLLELLQVAGEQTARLADGLEPLEQQLQRLLDELDATLRPRLEAPVRQRPLLAVGLAAGVGLLVGMLLSSRRR